MNEAVFLQSPLQKTDLISKELEKDDEKISYAFHFKFGSFQEIFERNSIRKLDVNHGVIGKPTFSHVKP